MKVKVISSGELLKVWSDDRDTDGTLLCLTELDDLDRRRSSSDDCSWISGLKKLKEAEVIISEGE